MPFLQVSLPVFLQTVSKSIPIYGTFLEGTSIYQSTLKPNGILVMGNEGNGISQKIEPFITQKLFIPPYPENSQPIDSLNVSTATAIIAAEFRRNQ
jgi:TrmH family RNA methyltransferase